MHGMKLVKEVPSSIIYINIMQKNRLIFRWILILFTLLMIALAIDMARNTTAPWNKNKAKTN
jgi:hypothetical protein